MSKTKLFLLSKNLVWISSGAVSGGEGGGGEGWWGPAQKPQNGKSKFLNLLILEHLKNYFIEHLNKSFDVL